jgi:predicted O-methyltransferase YrrM
MPVIGRLVELYRAEGIEIATGLWPGRFAGMPSANFTWFLRNGESVTNGLGIALQEVYFLEHLFAVYRPRRLFVIGNALGWSALALAALLPESRIVAIDAGFDRNSLEGLDLTNRIAAAAGFNLRAVQGVSPGDIGAIVDAELGGPVEFAFIDGLHTNAQIVLDYAAVAAKAASDAVYLFHDVAGFGLALGLAEIERRSGLKARLIEATPSGMALLVDPAQHPEITAATVGFAPSPQAVAALTEAGWEHRHRHLARWRRSLRKRVGRLRRRGGAYPSTTNAT